jgi:copper chaperone NosL
MTQLSVRSRILVAAAALLLVALFVLPLWKIQLYAPQYPEGLGMLIRVNTITGLAPNDLNSINGLNHYIGMKTIDPDAIPVLRYMPWVVGLLAAFGIGVAAFGRRAPLVAWLALFAAAGAAGLAEFYRWSYDYGHNLAADAIIKVPGMSYQPPLVGSKQLLNFTASSWPAAGGWLAGAAFLVAFAALFPWRRRKTSAAFAVARTAPVAAALLVATLASCTPAKPAIDYGGADCDFCRMRISDARFGSALVTRTGKVREFDSIECMVNYAATSSDARDARSAWVSDYDRPGDLIPASTAHFVRRQGPGSPMGGGLLAFSAAADSATLAARFGGTVMGWTELQAIAARGPIGPDRVHEEAAGAVAR